MPKDYKVIFRLPLYRTLCVTSLALIGSLLLPSSSRSADKIVWTAGIGYDYFSQTYQLDSLTTDTLEASLSIRNTYLNDFKGRIGLEHAPKRSRSMLLNIDWEQSRDEGRLNLSLDGHGTLGSWQISSRQEIERRADFTDPLLACRAFWHAQSRNTAKVRLGGQTWLNSQFGIDLVRFDIQNEYSRNYSRFGGKLGFMHRFGDFLSFLMQSFVTHREVPDSLAWNYLNAGIESSLFWMHETGELDLEARWEQKDYNQSGHADDFTRFEVTGYNRLKLGKALLLKQILELEMVRFGAIDQLSFDYDRLELEILGGLEGQAISLLIGPVFERLWEGASSPVDLVGTQDYMETGVLFEIDLPMSELGFFSVESILGRRSLLAANPTESDFHFERLNLMAESRVLGPVSVTLLLSADWEQHDISSENTHWLLISGRLTGSF